MNGQKIMPKNFKIGDRVILVSDEFADSSCDPRYGGRFGKTVGTIIHITEKQTHSILVEWNNDNRNKYSAFHLKYYENDEIKLNEMPIPTIESILNHR